MVFQQWVYLTSLATCACVGGESACAHMCAPEMKQLDVRVPLHVRARAPHYLLTRADFPFLKVNNLGPASCQLAPLCPRPTIWRRGGGKNLCSLSSERHSNTHHKHVIRELAHWTERTCIFKKPPSDAKLVQFTCFYFLPAYLINSLTSCFECVVCSMVFFNQRALWAVYT